MTEIGLVQQVYGEWNRSKSLVQLRIEAEKLEQPQEVLIAPDDVQELIRLLLVLNSKPGPAPGAPSEHRTVRPVPVDSVALGAADTGDTVLELNIGRTALAFVLPAAACRQLGETALTLSAARLRAAH